MVERTANGLLAPRILDEPSSNRKMLPAPDLNFLLIRRKAGDFKPARETCREFSVPDELSNPVQSKGLKFLSLLSLDAMNDGATVAPHGTLGSNSVLKPGALIGLCFRLEHETLEGLIFEWIPQQRDMEARRELNAVDLCRTIRSLRTEQSASPTLPSEQIHAPIRRSFAFSLGGATLPSGQVLGVGSRIILGKIKHEGLKEI